MVGFVLLFVYFFRLEIRDGNFVCDGVWFLQSRFHGKVRLYVERVRCATRVPSRAANYRHAGDGSLGRAVVPVFATSVFGGLLPSFRTRVGIGVERECSFQVRGSLGRRVVTGEVGLYSTRNVDGRASHYETASQSCRGIVVTNVFGGVPCCGRMVRMTRVFCDEWFMVRADFWFLYGQLVAFLRSLRT